MERGGRLSWAHAVFFFFFSFSVTDFFSLLYLDICKM